MPADLTKADEVINTGMDALLDALRTKSTKKEDITYLNSAIASVNSAVNVRKEAHAEKVLMLRILTLPIVTDKDRKENLMLRILTLPIVTDKDRKENLHLISPELKAIEQPKKKV